jgi:outer membrane biosynthesis protein TonB
MDAVSEVLAARTAKSDGLGSMLGWSAVAHLVMVAAVAFVPSDWWGAENKEPEVVMQISLGGAVGPRDGGLATLGGRAIQQVTETKKAVEPVRAPAAQTPAMIEPTKAPPRNTPTNKVDAKDPRSRTPTKGAEVRQGNTVAETGGKGMGFGLSSGGGGVGPKLDVANFCCPEYLATMLDLINRNWSAKQQARGTTGMRFVVQRDGRLVDISVEQSSGNANLDYMSQRALMLTKLPPLPAGYDQPALTVHLLFPYGQ